ncbi:MAG: LysM peptidoglycan-binding domain-containing protein [Puniceicoccaceae bacterium]|nr:MAG: LysM peptidoglycan-binding domain-containing protein [Puniceicoccaceae bacterium]
MPELPSTPPSPEDHPADHYAGCPCCDRSRISRRWFLLGIPALAGLLSTRLAAGSGDPLTHVVRRRETLSGIASTYGVTVQELAAANRIANPNRLQIGQRLVIPQPAPAFIEYTVRRGETLSAIAARHGTTVAELVRYNGLQRPDRISVGQVLRIPSSGGPAHPQLPSPIRAQVEGPSIARGRWEWIVIHHSGTTLGSARGMDRYHRQERRMANGLAYHFVIGNGSGMTDGEIHVGERWTRQLEGGHLASYQLNQVSIGICLVGDFERRAPNARQMEALEMLVRSLLRVAHLRSAAVTTHRLIHPRHTLCPGRHFPTEAFLATISR